MTYNTDISLVRMSATESVYLRDLPHSKQQKAYLLQRDCVMLYVSKFMLHFTRYGR